MDKKRPTTIRMDEQTRTSLAILAQRDGRSMSNYLAALVMREAKLTGAIAPAPPDGGP